MDKPGTPTPPTPPSGQCPDLSSFYVCAPLVHLFTVICQVMGVLLVIWTRDWNWNWLRWSHLLIQVLKQAGDSISAHLLHLINRIISSHECPKDVKLTKIVPIPKDLKDQTTNQGWRPINIVPAISMVVEKCLLVQVVNYLKQNNLIKHSHHGSIAFKSTQTLVHEIFDLVLNTLVKGEDSTLIQLDKSKSKAYNIISHT